MRIFIFRPCIGYSYCGGMVVVIAADYKRAVELAIAHPDFARETVGLGGYELAFFTAEEETARVSQHPDQRDWNGTNKWTLYVTYDLAGNPAETCIVDYNYA